MRITVALTPALLRDPGGSAVAVVDVLRATTTLVAMFDAGLEHVFVSDTIQQARKVAIEQAALLCGEVKSVQPAGFDYGNSPAELARAAVAGRRAVLFTTNGSRALVRSASAPFVAAAALTNRAAVAERLLAEADARGTDIAVVCAGTERGTAFSLEDTAAAGAVVERVHEADRAVVMTDEAWAALHLWHWYRCEPERVFRESTHARALRALGFEEDLAFAARVDASPTVPVLGIEGGLPVLRPWRSSVLKPA